MTRIIVVAVNVAVLAFAYMAVAVLQAGLTREGLPAAPARVHAALFVMRLMPFESTAFLGIVKQIAWAPAITALAALLATSPLLRPLRWAGVGASAGGLGYLLHTFPNLVSPDRIPLPLLILAGVFIVSAVLLAVLPARQDAASAEYWAVLFLVAFGFGGMGLLSYGVLAKMPPMPQLAVAAGCVCMYTAAFYCLVRSLTGLGKKTSPERMFFLMAPIALAGAGFVWCMPLALPIAAGLFVFAAAATA